MSQSYRHIFICHTLNLILFAQIKFELKWYDIIFLYTFAATNQTLLTLNLFYLWQKKQQQSVITT